MYAIEDGAMSTMENSCAYIMIGLYYILYFNSMYKFAMSFYNIMRNSKIDESDIY